MDEEFKLLKNEIKQVLLEIQEHVLNVQNPFSGAGAFGFSPAAAVAEYQAQAAPPPPPQQPQAGGGGIGGITIDASGAGGSGHGGAGGAGVSPSRGHEQASQREPPSPRAEERRDDRPSEAEDYQDAREDDYEERVSERPRSRRARRPAPSPRRGGRGAERPEYDEEDERPRAARHDYEPDDDDEADEPEAPARDSERSDRKMDLITLAGIAHWTDKLVRRVGREQTQHLLEVVARTGRISDRTKEVILALVPVFERRESQSALTPKQIIVMLAQLDGLMGTGVRADARLLPFLLEDDSEGFPLTRQ